MEQEIWKFHPHFNGMVEISDLGRVKSYYRYKCGKILKCMDDNGLGYLRIHINGHRYYIYRLVAELFVPNPENKPEVNHTDGHKWNNRADNLEWVTRSENQKHAYKLGLQKPSEKQKQAVSKWNKEHRIKKVYQYDTSGNLINTFESQKQAAKELNITTSLVSLILNNKRKSKIILKYN